MTQDKRFSLRDRGIKILVFILCLELLLQSISFVRFLYFQKRAAQNFNATLKNIWWLKNSRYNWFAHETDQIHMRYDPYRAWKMGEMRTSHITVDATGVRKTVGNPVKESANVQKIFFFGGSTTWGYNSADDQTIPSYFAQKINEKDPVYQITNYGQMGYTHTQSLIYLLMLLRENNIPDYVIFYDGCNDVYVPTLGPGIREIFKEEFLKAEFEKNNPFGYILPPDSSGKNDSIFDFGKLRSLLSHIKVIHYPTQLIQKIFTKENSLAEQEAYVLSEKDLNKFADFIVNNYNFGYSLIEALSKEYGFQYFTFLQPILVNKDVITPEEMRYQESALGMGNLENYKKLYQQVSNTLKEKTYPNHFDLTGIVKNNSESIFFDECHITPEINEAVAEEILKIFNERL